jgi:AAA family ATP:ADP antiporter
MNVVPPVVSVPEPAGSVLRMLGVERSELKALAWSFIYFFCLLCAYFVIRPVRDEMMVRFGAERMQWVYTSVFFIMLALTPAYGWLVARWPRRTFLPAIYVFFIGCLGVFWLLFHFNTALSAALGVDAGAFGRGSAAVLAIWITVFNLFVVSVFWSFMSDIYEPEQSRRLYATIATGGTLGALTGPSITRFLASNVPVDTLLGISAVFLVLCLVCIGNLVPWARAREVQRSRSTREEPIGGSVLAGARLVFEQPILRRLALLMACGVAVGAILYNQQIRLQSEIVESADRLRFFAGLDLWINLIAIVFQLGVTRFLLTRFGAGWLLVAPSLVVIGAMALIYGNPTVFMVAIAQVTTRGLLYGLLNPARETLFTRVDREARYKAKNFIDTAVWRGGDMTMQWLIIGLMAIGMTVASVPLVGIGIALAWFFSALGVRRWERQQEAGAALR